MKFRKDELDKNWKSNALVGCICVLFFVILINLGKIFGVLSSLQPLFIGIAVAYVINPLAVFFSNTVFKAIKKEKLKWVLSTVLAIIVVLLILSLMAMLLVPQIVDSVVSLAENYTVYISHLERFLLSFGERFGMTETIEEFIKSISAEDGLVNTIGEFVENNAVKILNQTTTIGAAAVNWMIGAIFAIYFLLAKSGIQETFFKLSSLIFSPLNNEKLRIVLRKFNNIFSKYIVCEILDAAIVGVVNYIFMTIAKMPNAIFISFVVAVANLAPTFGPIVGGAIGGFILLLIKPMAVIPFLIFTFALQTVDGYILKPKLFGDALNVPGVIILIAIIVFGKLMGVVGVLISIPVAAILVYIYKELLIPKLELNRDLEKYKKDMQQ